MRIVALPLASKWADSAVDQGVTTTPAPASRLVAWVESGSALQRWEEGSADVTTLLGDAVGEIPGLAEQDVSRQFLTTFDRNKITV